MHVVQLVECLLAVHEMGGLGVRGLAKMNGALLCKWLWRFANERGFL